MPADSNHNVDPESLGPVLLIGADGMLGRAWRRRLEADDVEVVAPSRDELDLTDADSVREHVTAHRPIVVNCAAWTDVDGAESHVEAAEQANGYAVGRLADRCAEVDALLVHYSTDYVFAGESRRPYCPWDMALPCNTYGMSKRLGETLIDRSRARWLLVRTSWLYAPWGKNFVLAMARLTAERDELTVVNDQRGRPTSAVHLAGMTWGLVQRGATGIYHVADGGECTWCDLACEVGRLVRPDCRIEPCTSEQFPRPAARPSNSVLDLGYIEAIFGPMPHWRDNVRAALAEAGWIDAEPAARPA